MSPVLVTNMLRTSFCIRNAVKRQIGQISHRCCSTGVLNIQDVRHQIQDLLGVEKGYQPLQRSRSHLLQLLPTNQDELPTRTMTDSFSSAMIPLSSDVELQEKYVMFLGNLRLGRLMEDMDIFAGWVANKHILNPKQNSGDPTPYILVTALVYQIDFTDIVPKRDADIRLSGHVSWVGRTSLETTVWLEQKLHGEWQELTRAYFIMVARNSTNTAAAIVNRLVPETDEEKNIILAAENRRKRRTQVQDASLLRRVPDANEQQIIHDMFVRTMDMQDPTFHKRVLPPNSMWMDEAQLSNIIFSHPEDRNIYNKVFGGFLMRNALEISWTTAYLHSKYQPKLCHISDIGFHKPVEVGSLIRMNSHVTYTEFNYMQIQVHAEVLDPHGQQNTTNNFHYTYQMTQEVPKVFPKSYNEAMMYLDGRRHFQHVMGLDGNKTT